MSLQAGILNFMLRRTLKKRMAGITDVEAFQAQIASADSLLPSVPGHVEVEAFSIGEIPCEWLWAGGQSGDRDAALLYLHGGGYVTGGLNSHRDVAWRLSRSANCRVLLIEYRLAPAHPFPAALEDATECYRWLLDNGYAPNKLAVAGDSAGGGLSLSLVMNARNLGLPLPLSLALISPWCDLSLSGDTVALNAKADAMLDPAGLEKMALAYLSDRDPRAPLASPLFGDLSGMPPMMIVAADNEILLSDSNRLAETVRALGGEASVDLWSGVPHAFPVFASRLPEGRKAIEQLGRFLRERRTTSAG